MRDALVESRLALMAKRTPNQYRSGFNQAPLTLAGRQRVLGAVDEALSVAALDGRTPRPLVLAGTRGVGKTVILGEAAARAADTYSWLTAPVEIRPETPFMPQLIEQLIVIRDLYRQSKPDAKISVTGATVRASVLGVGGEVERSRTWQSVTPALPLDAALSEACAAAAEHDAGVVITIDELGLGSGTPSPATSPPRSSSTCRTTGPWWWSWLDCPTSAAPTRA